MNPNSALKTLRKVKRMLWRLLPITPKAEAFSEIDLIRGILASRSRTGVMIDVGAQFGESMEPFLDMGWRVLAYEPDPNARKQAALDRMKGDRCQVMRIAVADREDEAVDFYTSEESTGISSLAAFRPTHKKTASVRVSTLAKEISRADIEEIDFLKIDTEGHDLFVLRGFPWHRSNLFPAAILCEFEDRKTVPLGYRWVDMASFVKSKGYTVIVSEWYPIERYGVQHRWRSVGVFPVDLADADGWGNLAAFKSASDANNFVTQVGRWSTTQNR